MSSKKKRIITFVMTLFLTFTFTVGYSMQSKREVYAEPITLSAVGMYYLIGALLVASGVTIANQNDVINISQHAYNDYKAEPIETQSKIFEFVPSPNSPNGMGRWKLGAIGMGWVSSLFTKLKDIKDVVPSVDYVNSVPTSGNYVEYKYDINKELPNLAFPDGATVYQSLITGSSHGINNCVYAIRPGADNPDYPGHTYIYTLRKYDSGLITDLGMYSSGWYDHNLTIRVFDGAVVVNPSDEVLKNYVPPLTVETAPPISIPYDTNTLSVPNADLAEFVGATEVPINYVEPIEPTVPTDPTEPTEPTTELESSNSILDWLKDFFKNLTDWFVGMMTMLFVPTKSISAWESLKTAMESKFPIIDQLKVAWSTSKDIKFEVPITYKEGSSIIKLPSNFEDIDYVKFRNILKYFCYSVTFFAYMKIIKPKLTINS